MNAITDFNATLRALADHIAQTYTGPEDTRIEIAHAIARHLGTEGWPSASPWRPIESAPFGMDVLVCDKLGNCYAAMYLIENGAWLDCRGYKVNAVMWTFIPPLPEPPKGGEDA